MQQFNSVVNDFVKHCRYSKSLSPHTVRAYAQDLSDFSSFVAGERELGNITASEVELWRIAAVISRRADLRWPIPREVSELLPGQVIDSVERRAK
jgi:site-specific recombinase XerD